MTSATFSLARSATRAPTKALLRCRSRQVAFVPTLDPVNPIPLTATSTDNFVAADGTPVTFIPDATGNYTYVYSRPFVAVRTP